MKENEKKENKIKELLKEYNLTIKDFAEITGAPARTVENWSSGRRELKEYEINWVREYVENHIKNFKKNEKST